MNEVLSLDEVVAKNLACLELGLDSKAVVKENILKAVSDRCIPLPQSGELEAYPREYYEALHNRFGLAFEYAGGRITGVKVEPKAKQNKVKEIVNG